MFWEKVQAEPEPPKAVELCESSMIISAWEIVMCEYRGSKSGEQKWGQKWGQGGNAVQSLTQHCVVITQAVFEQKFK